MAIKLLEGSYPQIPSKFTLLNSKEWTEKTLRKHGHKLIGLRLKELTLRSDNFPMPIEKLPEIPYPLKEVWHAMEDTTLRDNNQKKMTPRFNMDLVTIPQVEVAVRELINHYNAKDGKRNGYKVNLWVQHMLTMKKGIVCWWTLIDKKTEGKFMILIKVDGKHVGQMDFQERNNTFDLSWAPMSCDVSSKDIKVKKRQLQCASSGTEIKLG